MNIEAMAREAGLEREGTRWFSDSSDPLDAQDVEHAALERFAALVRAQALEDVAQMLELWDGSNPQAIVDAIRAIAATKTEGGP